MGKQIKVLELVGFVRTGLGRLRSRTATRRISSLFQQSTVHVDGSAAFSRLHAYSLAITSVSPADTKDAQLNVVLPELHLEGIFAGIRTALEFASKLATAESRNLRLLPLSNTPDAAAQAGIASYMAREFGFAGEVTVRGGTAISGLSVGRSDLWLATHWTTSHSLDIAARLGIINARNVVYLVQDYEPGFHPWSTDFALARSTYHAGFRLIVNSTPLQRYLATAEGITVDPAFVFGPSLDMAGAERAAAIRKNSPTARVLFYGRPSKPRNLFDIGVAALALAAEALEHKGIAATFTSAGEKHSDVQLSPAHRLVSRGKLSWQGYFDLLGHTDVILSLQHSPHPSHPPLDAVTSGAFAVTNEMAGTRNGLHRRYLVAEPEAQALANQLVAAIERALSDGTHGFDPDFAALFGLPIDDVIAALTAREPDDQ